MSLEVSHDQVVNHDEFAEGGIETGGNRRSLKLRRDIIEGRREVGSNQLECTDRGNRDQGGDQPIFDGGCPILVVP